MDFDALMVPLATAPLRTLLVLYYCVVVAMAATTFIRLYTRIYLLKQFGADDFLMSFSLLNFVGLWATHKQMNEQTWLLETAAARSLAVVADASWVRRLRESEKQLWIMCINFPLILTVFKLSVLAFYRRFLPQKPYHIWIDITSAISVLFGIATALATVFQCIPVQKAWDPLVAEHFRRLDVYTLVIVIGAFNLFTDIILLLLPVPVVSKLHTNRKRKGMFFWLYIVLNLSQVGLIVLFSLGALGTALTAVRLWKTVVVARLQHRRAVGLGSFAALAIERLVLVLLSGLETAIIPICANGPALAACWRTGGRCQRANAPAMHQQLPRQLPQRQQQQQQQRWRSATVGSTAWAGRRGGHSGSGAVGIVIGGQPARHMAASERYYATPERSGSGAPGVSHLLLRALKAAVTAIPRPPARALKSPRVAKYDSSNNSWKGGCDGGGDGSLSSICSVEKLSVTLGPSFEEMAMPEP